MALKLAKVVDRLGRRSYHMQKNRRLNSTRRQWSHYQELTPERISQLREGRSRDRRQHAIGPTSHVLQINSCPIEKMSRLGCARAIKPTEVIPGGEDDPYAKKTALGWGVIGVVSPNKNEDDNHCSCHRIASLQVQPSNGKRMCHFALKTQTKEVFASAQWAKMLELDFNETSREEQPLSLLDRKFLSVLEPNIRHRDDDHYEIPLPLKEEGLKLPNNRTLALSRLERLKQRLTRDRKYREHYEAFMKEDDWQGTGWKGSGRGTSRLRWSRLVYTSSWRLPPAETGQNPCRLRCQHRIQGRFP